ncbi:hypothetical protein HDV01_006851 [Terramyces sp. JEL0728]|nr:hypothetical protein HDV01_006851 [Terramyces sp. JEL0728]
MLKQILYFASAICAQLAPGEVTINQITYQGDGCPDGSVQSVLSPDATVFTVLYSSFVASSGPGVAATENKKACTVVVDLKHAHGYTYTALNLDYRGYISVPAGLNAELKTSHYFDTEPDTPNFQHVFPGPFDNDYLFSATNPVKQRNACGVKSRARLRTVIRLFGKNTDTLAGYISGDSLDGSLHTNATRQCITYRGSGCPPESAKAILSSNATVFTIIYTRFVASSGRNIALVNNSKECTLILELIHPKNCTYTDFSLVDRGYVSIPSGLKAEISTRSYFNHTSDKIYHHTFTGPFANDYAISVNSSIPDNCACRKKSRVRFSTKLRLVGDTATIPGYISADSLDGNLASNFTHNYHLKWKKCQ